MVKKIAELKAILADEKLLLGVIKTEILAISEKYADAIATKNKGMIMKTVMAELKEMRQEVERMKDKLLSADIIGMIASAKEIDGIKVVTAIRSDLAANDLRKFGDLIRDKDAGVVAVFASATDAKVTFVASCGKEAVAKGLKAGDIIRAVCAVAGGKGGGKPDSAMGGGTEVSKTAEALESVYKFVNDKIGG